MGRTAHTLWHLVYFVTKGTSYSQSVKTMIRGRNSMMPDAAVQENFVAISSLYPRNVFPSEPVHYHKN